jgi:uncharacterized YccA/Bax inhibitor family protein
MIATSANPRRMQKAFERVNDTYPGAPARILTAAGVYDKTAIMAALALVAGVGGYLSNNGALILGGIVVGFVLSLVGIFKPQTAKYVAPIYSLAEGVALGGISAYYASTSGSGIVPLAIIYTGGIFIGALIVFRSGLVKITPKFMSMVMIGCVGFLLVTVATIFGLPIPGLSGNTTLLVLGVLGVFIGVAFLFMDFNMIQVAEQQKLSADGEWYMALTLMMALVFVYLNVLRILGRR